MSACTVQHLFPALSGLESWCNTFWAGCDMNTPICLGLTVKDNHRNGKCADFSVKEPFHMLKANYKYKFG